MAVEALLIASRPAVALIVKPALGTGPPRPCPHTITS
jgi:hypothetical protein